MSLTSYIATAKANLKSDLLSFFNDTGEKTKDQAAEALANMIMQRTKELIENGAVNVTVPNVSNGSETKSGTGGIA